MGRERGEVGDLPLRFARGGASVSFQAAGKGTLREVNAAV